MSAKDGDLTKTGEAGKTETGLWVFGYGSLMWRPGFPHLEAVPARLEGYHRQLCVFSSKHRGTHSHPGLVMGLVPGGACLGRAFRIASADRTRVLAYLDDREDGYPYGRRPVTVVLLEDGARVRASIQAETFLPVTSDPRFAGEIDIAEAARYVRQGEGVSGACSAYLAAAIGHLREMGIRDDRLEALYARVIADADGDGDGVSP